MQSAVVWRIVSAGSGRRLLHILLDAHCPIQYEQDIYELMATIRSDGIICCFSRPFLHLFDVVQEPVVQARWQTGPLNFWIDSKQVAYVTEIAELIQRAHTIFRSRRLRNFSIVAPGSLIQRIALRRRIGCLLGDKYAAECGEQVAMLRVYIGSDQGSRPVRQSQWPQANRRGFALNGVG